MGRSRSNSIGSSKKKAKAHKRKKASAAAQHKKQHARKSSHTNKNLLEQHFLHESHRKTRPRSSSQSQPVFRKAAPQHPPQSASQQSKKRKRKRNDSEIHLGNYHSIVEASMGLSCQLPPKHAGQRLHQIPWMSPEARSAAAQEPTLLPTTKHTKKSRNKAAPHIRLPTDDVDPVRLEHLTLELRDLAAYVRLTPDEMHARQNVIQDLTRLAQSIATFPNSNLYPNHHHIRFTGGSSTTQSDNDKDGIHFRTFGSFAAPDVCTFVSDVDLALWGAVRAVPLSPWRHRTSPTTTVSQNTMTPEKKRQQALAEKWKSALDAMDADNAVSPGNIPASTMDDDDDNVDDDDNGHSDAPDDELLFVIDRVGDAENDSESLDDGLVSGAERKEDYKPVIDLCSPDRSNKDSRTKESDVIDLTNSPTVANDGIDNSDDAVQDQASDSDDQSDDDSADKLEAFDASTQPATQDSASSLQRLKHLVSRSPSSSDDESDNNTEDDEQMELLHQWGEGKSEFDGMEVGFVGGEADGDEDDEEEEEADNFTVLKRDAIDALNQLQRRLRRARNLASDINFIRHARVPIVKFKSPVGVEFDISIGGQNGADTSLYAGKQCKRYESFAPVVLALKIIMAQQDLDTPFTGGLGSFKLYVLVAHHIQQHLALGGQDRPGEIFLSFLFRYGSPSATGDHCVDEKARTFLSQEACPKCEDGCEADLSNVFKIADCCHLFGAVWKRLWGRVRYLGKSQRGKSGSTPPASLLAELINADKLARDRESSREDAAARQHKMTSPNTPADKHTNPYANQGVAVRMPPGPPHAAKSQSKKASAAKKSQNHGSRKKQNNLGDKDAFALMAGYGVFGRMNKKARR